MKMRQRVTPKSPSIVQHFRAPEFEIHLSENEGGVKIPDRVQIFKTGNFKKRDEKGNWITFQITREHLAEIVQNFDDKVRGIDLALDFAHRSDDVAAAWFKGLEIIDLPQESQLWGTVSWTPDGYAAVGAKKFRYLSADFAFEFADNETGKQYGTTLFGAGLTNRPVLKGMAPVIELTEGKKMKPKKSAKKIETETLAEKRRLAQAALQLDENDEMDEMDEEEENDEMDEMADTEDDGADPDTDTPPPPQKKLGKKAKGGKMDTVSKAQFDELSAKFSKQSDELASVKKSMIKSLAEAKRQADVAKFNSLVLGGKAVEAQREAFMEGDTIKFAELSEPVKFETYGGQGVGIPTDTSAQDEVLKLSEDAVKAGKVTHSEAISWVLKTNPKLNARYIKEMETQG